MQFFRVFLLAFLLLLQAFDEASSISKVANSLENIAGMNAPEDAAKHLKRRGANERASHVATDATAYHLVPMDIRRFVHVMQASRPMAISLNALNN
ncbi:hypothetical protein RIF29_18432 [Crotalaria pallida]|uniref:RxLR effector protein n=1 Tax=Crotalaria pallida TaxID=3830 RepID=A0AAN9FL74_CROPI